MLRNIQHMGRGQRILVFILIFGGGLLVLILLTVVLILSSINAEGRQMSVALAEGVAVREFAQLPGNDAYPAALAVAPDGRVYTGSYQTGALWVIDTTGSVTEIPGSRETIGSVAGLAAAPDGALYIVDRLDANPRVSGGEVKRLTPDGAMAVFASITDERGFLAPDDVTLDAAGNVYVSDRGRDEVWRFASNGEGIVWWTPPVLEGVDQYEPTGLAYDATQDSILITDGINDIIYRVSVSDGATETLYRHGQRPNAPGLDGLTVTPDGAIYAAALAQNGIVRFDGDTLTYIAGLFRGASDVDFAAPDRLYVTNFDSFSLVIQAVAPRLPFAIDEITLP